MKKLLTLMIAVMMCATIPSIASAYTVQPGDTMYLISKKFGIPYRDLVRMNPNIKDPNNIVVGMHVNTDQERAELIVDYAVSLQGKTQYKLGADTSLAPWVADCSSWTQHIYKKYGVNLPRTSPLQSQVGTSVLFRNMKKGDLMFFGKGKVTHVGIYMGNGYYISALNPEKDVQIYSIYETWSYSTFLWAKRVL